MGPLCRRCGRSPSCLPARGAFGSGGKRPARLRPPRFWASTSTDSSKATTPPVRAPAPIDGPAVVAASWFAPTGDRIAELEHGTAVRRLAHRGTTVAWLVPAGERWEGPQERGDAVEVEGLLLRGSFDLVTALERFLCEDCTDFRGASSSGVPEGSVVLGDPADVIVMGAAVEPGVVFDVRQGAVVLEAGVEVRHGTRLEGPVFVGTNSKVLGGFIRASTFGPECRVHGEIATSAFLGYANKAHDGFVGHSVVGHWVNLGALTTTSNLKNTYGPVRLVVGDRRIDTGRQYLGTLFGDHAKTAIGTMLGTGTVVGTGANVFGRRRRPSTCRRSRGAAPVASDSRSTASSG